LQLKKWVLLVLAIIVALSLAACGGGGDNGATVSSNASPKVSTEEIAEEEVPFEEEHPVAKNLNTNEAVEVFCPNCNADLSAQPGFDSGAGYWKCTVCGQTLLNPDNVVEDARYKDVAWFCDDCGAFLNEQPEFSDWNDTWTCTECGFENPIADSEIISNETTATPKDNATYEFVLEGTLPYSNSSSNNNMFSYYYYAITNDSALSKNYTKHILANIFDEVNPPFEENVLYGIFLWPSVDMAYEHIPVEDAWLGTNNESISSRTSLAAGVLLQEAKTHADFPDFMFYYYGNSGGPAGTSWTWIKFNGEKRRYYEHTSEN
jgi:DNA-directed RNA polymerase subunit M/transcription elongation factor TFIIS